MVEGATIDCKMIKKEFEMTGYAMYTEAGDKAVAGIVKFAKEQHLDWPGVYGMLQQLAKKEEFAEATDTMVREIVYDAMGFTSDFYV